jgi:hypothetical protein
MPGNSRTARAAVLFGALAVLAIPGAVFGSRLAHGVTLLHALYAAVPAACLLGLVAVASARRARFAAARSVRPDATGPVRVARLLAWAGLYVGITAALALGVYGALRWAQ